MITEDYVSFRVARLLQEKGFDEKCHSAWLYNPREENSECFVEYLAKGTENNTDLGYFNEPDTDWAYSAPTLQRAMKWLREVHNLHIGIVRGPKGYHITIETIPLGVVKYITREIVGTTYVDSCEEACDAAIKYCLENLI